EFGIPADGDGRVLGNRKKHEFQYEFINDASDVIFQHAAGYTGSGIVLGAFIREATDRRWKISPRNDRTDGHYGILGKHSEKEIQAGVERREEVLRMVPRNDSLVELENAAWRFLQRARAGHADSYGVALFYAQRLIRRTSIVEEHVGQSFADSPRTSVDSAND